MGIDWKEWNRNDLIYGIVAPVLVVLLIVAISQLGRLFSGGFSIATGITMELQELVVIVAVPLMLGLIWNRWAGGASGFLLGSLYALYWADSYHSSFGGGRIVGYGTVLLGYIISAMLIGYMAGTLNKRSENFRRMLLVGVTSATIGGVLLFGVFQLSPANVVTGWDGFLITVLSRSACGAIIPVIAKFFMWYGVTAAKKPDSCRLAFNRQEGVPVAFSSLLTKKLHKLEGRTLLLKDPEKSGGSCLDFEDAMDALRLKAGAIRDPYLDSM